MYSQLFCGTLETSTLDSTQKKEDEFLVKIYIIELSKYQELVSGTLDILSATERGRANRYHFEKDRNRFIICRTLLKFLLAQHIGLKIDEISIEIDSNKKPYLFSHPSIFFNVSHSGHYAVIAIAKSPIGIDIEYINKEFKYQEIVTTVFNKLEIVEITNNKDKHQTFYKFWTRKEAIVKAIGKGVDDDIINVSVTDGKHSVSLAIVKDFKTINAFSFSINENYVGALALTQDLLNFENIFICALPNSKEVLSLI